MCTVIAGWRQDNRVPVQILALRDEFAGRDFDPPGEWWPDQPGVVGGRDRRGGGSWCVSHVDEGVTAVVLNRPDRMYADAGAASRGVLPLLAVRYGQRWADHVDVAPMAGFNLVLLSPDALVWWSFDGTNLVRSELGPGGYVFKPGGLTVELPDRRLGAGGLSADVDVLASPTARLWNGWFDAVRAAEVRDDGAGLLVRRPVGADSYETVFGQFIAARPGALRLDYLDHPARGTDRSWTTRVHTEAAGSSHGSSGARSWVT